MGAIPCGCNSTSTESITAPWTADKIQNTADFAKIINVNKTVLMKDDKYILQRLNKTFNEK